MEAAIGQLAQTNLGAGQIDENRDWLAGLLAQRADIVDMLLLNLRAGMGHVEAEGIDPCLEELG